MGRKATVTTTAIFGLLTALVACSSAELPKEKDCSETPKAKGCKQTAAQTAAAPVETPLTTAPTPVGAPLGVDAGYDSGIRKPDGGVPGVPTADVACRDLLNCCGRVQDTIERAACFGIGYAASSGSCANAIIAYQVAGGCGHNPFDLPDIFNPDGTVNGEKDCYYLEQSCWNYGDCYGYENSGCNIQSTGTTPPAGGYCSGLDTTQDSCGRSPYMCCEYGDFYCEPFGSYCYLPEP